MGIGIHLLGPGGLNEETCVHMLVGAWPAIHTDGWNGSCAAEVFLICSHTMCDICRTFNSIRDGNKNTLAEMLTLYT